MPAARKRWQATLIITLFLLAVAGAAFTGWRFARESPPHQGPIVLITADGLRADRKPTSNIEALASRGIDFERAYTHAPQALPAHAALLTGELPFDNGVRDDGGFALKNDAQRRVLLRGVVVVAQKGLGVAPDGMAECAPNVLAFPAPHRGP